MSMSEHSAEIAYRGQIGQIAPLKAVDAPLPTEIGVMSKCPCCGGNVLSSENNWCPWCRSGACTSSPCTVRNAPLPVAAGPWCQASDPPDESETGDEKARVRHFEPNPDQPDRCPSMDPYDSGLQCTRLIHDDDQCHAGQIAWRKGTPRYVSDRERLASIEAQVAVWERSVSTYRERHVRDPKKSLGHVTETLRGLLGVASAGRQPVHEQLSIDDRRRADRLRGGQIGRMTDPYRKEPS